MKILEEVKNIFDKYELSPISLPNDYKNIYEYLRDNEEQKSNYSSPKDDSYFIQKYHKNISPGHYGFALGDPIIKEWCEIIDEVLELCIKIDPEFEIMQIKIKFGGVRFYVNSEIIEDIFETEVFIGECLFDKTLIY